MDLSFFFIILSVGSFVLGIVILIKWWNMADDIKAIKQKLTTSGDEKISYLLALGEKEHAEKLVLTRLINIMYPIYAEGIGSNLSKDVIASNIDNGIQSIISGYSGFKISIPEYVRSGHAFIEYMDEIVGEK